ncbi:MAG TPA: hypothetical protein VLD37_01330 [Candidatus Bilamarchaeum sp.]|nr:hypothetical protein [Candidatus Bilamarchaeum sp.]
MTRRHVNDEDTQPDIRLGGKGVFARLFPRFDCWAENIRRANRLLEAADAHERRASEWKAKGHFERAGHSLEKAAHAVGDSVMIDYSLKAAKRQQYLFRDAMVCYALEMKEEDRYDPGIDWGMYRVARAMGESALAVKHFSAAVGGFENMIQDPKLDTIVRLGRLKRRLLERICEKDVLSAIILTQGALDMALQVRPEPEAKVAEVRGWAMRRFLEETGGASEFFMQAVESYRPRAMTLSRP